MKNIPVILSAYSTMKNCGIATYGPEGLIENLKKGYLKGKLKEVASKLHEEDNKVIMLVKYK